MFHRIYAIAKKEMRQLKRDTRMLAVLFLFPVLLLAIFGYAINFDVKHIKIAVYDRDRSPDSRGFINSITSSEYFDIVDYIESDHQIKDYLDNQKVQAVIVFPQNTSRLLHTRKDTPVQILIDGVNGNTATIVMNYMNLATRSFSQDFNAEVLGRTGRSAYVPVDIRPVFWYNPSLNSTHFLIPGLIAMILIITAVISIALSIVREKETGTIEQINVSPLSPMELIIGKTTPFALLALLIAAMILVAGYFLFGIVVKGNYLLLLLTTLLFVVASLSLGIFVSAVSDSQQVAFQIASLISMLPSTILSGFIFPIESMPAAIQWLTNVTPAKFYLTILRDIMLKGVGLEAFWPQVIYLIIFSAIFIGLAAVKQKKTA